MRITDRESRVIDWYRKLTAMEQEAVLNAVEHSDYTLLHRLQQSSELLRSFDRFVIANCQNEPFLFFG